MTHENYIVQIIISLFDLGAANQYSTLLTKFLLLKSFDSFKDQDGKKKMNDICENIKSGLKQLID